MNSASQARADRARTAPPSKHTDQPDMDQGAVDAPATRPLGRQGKRTRRKLLDAALEVFATQGYFAARVDDIVALANTSHGTFYLYFTNKEDVLRALVAEAGQEVLALDASLGEITPDEQGWKELRTWVEQFSNAWQHHSPVIRAWIDVMGNDTEFFSTQAHGAVSQISSILAKRIERATRPGEVDPEAAAEAVIAMIDQFHFLRRFAGEPIDSACLDTLTTIIHGGIFGGPGARRR
jgi:AcrR family transcriptional regulator